MDIRDLTLFRHLTGTLHFARTSHTCFITPSALTRVIQRLEEDLGKKLFIRDNRTVELTAAGAALKRYADDVLWRWDQLNDELSADDVLKGELSLYCSVTAAYGILPDILGSFRHMYPQVRIHLETGDAAKALGKLSSQDADMVIAAQPDLLPDDIIFQTIEQTPLVFIASVHHPDMIVHGPKGIDWEQTPLIIPDRGLSRDRIDRFAQTNRVPKIDSRVGGNEAIIVMVSLGCGIGLVPRLVLEKSPLFNQIRILDETPQLPPFVVGLCTRKKNLTNPRVKALWHMACEG